MEAMRNEKNNRKMVIILLVVVIILWGGIFRRLFVYIGHKDKIEKPVKSFSPTLFRTDSLSFAYRDPFEDPLGTASPSVIKTISFRNTTLQESLPPAPSFRLRGKIRKGKKDFLLLEFPDGHTLVWDKGKIDGYKVRKVYADSVVVVKQGKDYTLLIH